MRHQRLTIGLDIRGTWREVRVEYTPARPGRWYMKNGDPGYPDEPEEFDILAVEGMEVEDLTKDEISDIELEASEAVRDAA